MVAAFGVYVISVAGAIYKGILTAPELSNDESGSDSDDASSDSGVPGETTNYMAQHPEINTETSALLRNDEATPSGSRQHEPHALGYHICQLLIGFVALSISGYILSHSASSIADSLHLSGTFLGITILSFATTLPEKFVAVIAGARGESGIVIANTVGSNIFLLTLCLGVVVLSGDLERHGNSVLPFELAVTWLSSALLFLVVFYGLGRWAGFVLIIFYVLFLVLEFTLYRR